jgi:hypothetical protein
MLLAGIVYQGYLYTSISGLVIMRIIKPVNAHLAQFYLAVSPGEQPHIRVFHSRSQQGSELARGHAPLMSGHSGQVIHQGHKHIT